MKARMKRLLLWLKAHLVVMQLEKDKRTDSKGGAVGFRFWF